MARAEATAGELGHNYIGVEHLLLAILDEDGSVAAAAIRNAGCTDAVRRELETLMNRHSASAIRRP